MPLDLIFFFFGLQWMGSIGLGEIQVIVVQLRSENTETSYTRWWLRAASGSLVIADYLFLKKFGIDPRTGLIYSVRSTMVLLIFKNSLRGNISTGDCIKVAYHALACEL